MKFDPQKHHRRSVRLQGYDYAQAGAYFVTLVTYQREALFGEIIDNEMKLNRKGEIVQEEWFASVDIREEIRLHDAGTKLGRPWASLTPADTRSGVK